jgi:hypothetical protein
VDILLPTATLTRRNKYIEALKNWIESDAAGKRTITVWDVEKEIHLLK